jgi:DNA-binding NarL/FixJ family response regulator
MTAVPESRPPQEKISVAVVEDSDTFRRNIQRLLTRTPGFRCAGTCTNGREALQCLPEMRPDVVLMDIHMPEMNGIECTTQLKAILPKVQIIILTVYEDTETIFKALRSGASGYLLKRTAYPEILNAIREIRQGGAPMSSAIARKIVEAFQEPPSSREDSEPLSAREKEILDWLAQGFSNKEIGAKLDISQFTVKVHLAHIFEKLHVRSRTEAVLTYLQQRGGPGAHLPVGRTAQGR